MKKILVGIDNSPRMPSVLAAATQLASRMNGKLLFFRAVSIPSEPLPEEYLKAPIDYGKALEQKAQAEVEAATRDISPELVDGIHVEFGIPWDALCRVARENDVDCIVIGSHGYGVIDRLLGTTAAKVVNHADRSVLVVRAAERITS